MYITWALLLHVFVSRKGSFRVCTHKNVSLKVQHAITSLTSLLLDTTFACQNIKGIFTRCYSCWFRSHRLVNTNDECSSSFVMSHYKLYIQQICAMCIWARTWDICSKQIAENSFDITYPVTVWCQPRKGILRYCTKVLASDRLH